MKPNPPLLIILFILICPSSIFAQVWPDLESTLNSMRIANQYFFDKYSPESMADPTRPGNIWTRSTYIEGLLALYTVDPDPAFYNYAVDWAKFHRWGMRSGPTTRNADDQCCGQSYIEMYNIDPQPERIRDISASIDRMVNSSQNSDWNWIDAIHMAMPVFAKLGVLSKDNRYFSKMYSLYSYTRNNHGSNGLYNQADGLWWRDSNFDPPYSEPNGKNCYWSRGNGWVFAALVRVLDILPKNENHRDEYIQTFQEMAAAIIQVQREDGFWNVSLHDPDYYGGPETSGTAFFTYGLAWGVRMGLLKDDAYLAAAIKGWQALSELALHDNGFLGYVQSTGKQPSDGQPLSFNKAPNYEDYGLGAFLLAGSEISKLIKASASPTPTQQPKPQAGDVNNDGAINIVDSLLIAQFYVSMPVDIDVAAADVDCSQSVNIVDALLIGQFYVGWIDFFPLCD